MLTSDLTLNAYLTLPMRVPAAWITTAPNSPQQKRGAATFTLKLPTAEYLHILSCIIAAASFLYNAEDESATCQKRNGCKETTNQTYE